MKSLTSLLVLSFVCGNANATITNCQLDGKTIEYLNNDSTYELQFSVKTPFSPKLFQLLEKYFGKLSKKNCINSIEITKIKNKKTSESYFAFYTNQTQCDGGNSYGIIFKDSDFENPFATIDDSYIDCR